MRTGTKHTDESRGRMRAAKLGKPLSDAHRAAVSAGVRAAFARRPPNKGRKLTDEHRKAIAAGVRAWWARHRPTQGAPMAPVDEPLRGYGRCKTTEPPSALSLATERTGVQVDSNGTAEPPRKYDCAA